MFNSRNYWNQRYLKGGNSGNGSYNNNAIFKGEIINKFIKNKNIKSLIDFGVGDGNQLGDLPGASGRLGRCRAARYRLGRRRAARSQRQGRPCRLGRGGSSQSLVGPRQAYLRPMNSGIAWGTDGD